MTVAEWLVTPAVPETRVLAVCQVDDYCIDWPQYVCLLCGKRCCAAHTDTDGFCRWCSGYIERNEEAAS
jgi:hypothetical protein